MDRESQKAYEQFVREQDRYNAGHANVTQANQASYPSAGNKQFPSYADIQDAARQRNQHEKNVQFQRADPVAQAMRQSDAAWQPSSATQVSNSVHQPSPPAPRGGGVTVGPLGLYGQLPQAGTQRSSPLDSPDNLRQITFTSEGADFDPDIDPTGTLLVYASTQHRATADLYLKRITGSALQQLTDDPANDVMPAFSPDGKRVAFASDRAGNWDIYLMDVAGGQPRQLTNDLNHDLSPSFSPDGQHLAYCTYGTQSGQWELVVIDVDNPNIKRFIGYGLFPEWSPVDNRIVFQRARERGTRWFSVWTMELVNGEGVRPTEIAASSNAAAIAPSWSPDGTRLTFSTVLDPDSEQQLQPVQADIWLINADGSGRTNLSNSRFANVHPVWSKTGTIFFVSNRGRHGVENIWEIRPDRALRVYEPVSRSLQPSAMGPETKTRASNRQKIANYADAMVPTR